MCPECRSLAVIFTLDHVSLACFTAVVFSPLHCDPALSVFAPKCQGECHAVKAALCDLGDPGWGEPWFPHWALVILWFFLLFVLWACVSMTHKLSSACAELILSYHFLSQQIFFTQNWNLSRHCFVVVWFFVFCVGCFCLCLFFLLFLLLVLCVSALVF